MYGITKLISPPLICTLGRGMCVFRKGGGSKWGNRNSLKTVVHRDWGAHLAVASDSGVQKATSNFWRGEIGTSFFAFFDIAFTKVTFLSTISVHGLVLDIYLFDVWMICCCRRAWVISSVIKLYLSSDATTSGTPTVIHLGLWGYIRRKNGNKKAQKYRSPPWHFDWKKFKNEVKNKRILRGEHSGTTKVEAGSNLIYVCKWEMGYYRTSNTEGGYC